MKIVKHRNALTDKYLSNELIVVTSDISVKINTLIVYAKRQAIRLESLDFTRIRLLNVRPLESQPVVDIV